MARDVNRRIIMNDEALPHFARASQNITVVAVLIRTLLERAAAQQAESSLSR